MFLQIAFLLFLLFIVGVVALVAKLFEPRDPALFYEPSEPEVDEIESREPQPKHWIEDAADAKRRIREEAPVLWRSVQDALERDLAKYKRHFPDAAIAVVDFARDRDSVQVTFETESGLAELDV